MKKCPFCQKQIEDDSRFCDQCGKELRVCPQCGEFGRGKICSRCGVPLVTATGIAPSVVSSPETVAPSKTLSSSQESVTSSRVSTSTPAAGTSTSASFVDLNNTRPPKGGMSVDPSGISLVHEGITIKMTEMKGHYIIGRREGEFCMQLQGFRYISGVHASIDFDNISGVWKITDKGSTNGSFLNGERLVAGTSHFLKVGDVIRFADINFTVI